VKVTKELIHTIKEDRGELRYVVGQALFPMVRQMLMCSTGLASKVTGMMLELPIESLCCLVEDLECLKSALHEALDTLQSAGMLLVIRSPHSVFLYTKDGQMSPVNWNNLKLRRFIQMSTPPQYNIDPDHRRMGFRNPCCQPVNVQTLFAAGTNDQVAAAINLEHYRKHYAEEMAAAASTSSTLNRTMHEEDCDDEDYVEEDDDDYGDEPGVYQVHSRPFNRVPNNNVLWFFKHCHPNS
jgi:hypothetical protein